MAFYQEQDLELLRQTADVVDFIGRYVQLTKKGNHWFGLCPFHSEKTPSFSVNRDKQIFHCYGCGVGGDVFSFLMKKENMTFPDAVEYLAEVYGVTLTKRENPTDRKKQEEREKIYAANRAAARIFFQNLRKHSRDEEISAFLRKRRIGVGAANALGLGYAEQGWDNLKKELMQQGFSEALLVKAGLCVTNTEKKRTYDRFRHRIIFPIQDVKGRVIGFGGRVLDDSLPKYLNSPETPVYNKGRELYGLNFTKKNLTNNRPLLIVEGYMDFLSLYAAGIDHVAAVLGTALTEHHARLIRHYTNKVILSLDSDAAGSNATLRSLDILTKAGLSVQVLTLDGGKDPDEYIKTKGVTAFKEQLLRALPRYDFELMHYRKGLDLRKMEDRMAFSEKVVPMLRGIDNRLLRQEYLQKAADLGLNPEALEAEVKRGELDVKFAVPTADKTQAPEPTGKAPIQPAERMLLKLLLEKPAMKPVICGRLKPGDMENETLFGIFKTLEQEPWGHGSDALKYFDDEKVRSYLAGLLHENMDFPDPIRVMEDCFARIQDAARKRRMKILRDELKRCETLGDEAGVRNILLELTQLTEQGGK